MTEVEIIKRYKDELKLIKERCGFSDKELGAFIEGYSAGQECLLEELKEVNK